MGIFALCILVCIHVVVFALAGILGNRYLADSYGYLHQAHNIFTYGSWYAEDWYALVSVDYFSFRPPLYALFLGLVLYLIKSHVAIILVQNLLSIASVLLVVNMMRNILKLSEFLVWYVAISLCVMMPTSIIMANMVMAESVFQFLFTLLAWLCMQLIHGNTKNNKYILGISLVLSAMILTKPVSLLLPIAVLIWIWFFANTSISKRLRVKTSIFVIILPLITYHLICLQQQHQTGFYHYTSIKPVTQQRYNARYTLAAVHGQAYAESWNDSCKLILANAPDYATRYNTMQQMGDEIIRTHTAVFLKNYVKGMLVFFMDPGRHDIFTFFGWISDDKIGLFHKSQASGWAAITDEVKQMPLLGLVILLAALLANLITFLALLVSLFIKWTDSNMKWYVLIMISYIATATGTLGVARYKTAIMPLLIIVTVVVSHKLIRKYTKHHA
jgi:hypothetical protein